MLRSQANIGGFLHDSRNIIGLIERVKIIGKKEVEVEALIDTGATRTSVDPSVAKKAELGPICGDVKVKQSSSGYTKRIVVKGEIEIAGKRIKTKINIQDRSKMYTPVLIGRDIIHSNFIVDVAKTHKSKNIRDRIMDVD